MPRGRLPVPRSRGQRLSVGSLLLLLLIVFVVSRAGLLADLQGGGSGLPFPEPYAPSPSGGATAGSGSAAEERLVDFVSFVLDDVQETWAERLPGYRPAKLVLFRGQIRSGCGFAAAQMGPFYCPIDEKVYVDLSFYEELRRRFGAPGDFAQAYVLAHEIGHHVQKLTGVEPDVRAQQRARPDLANELSVRMELQADCLAGVWGGSAGQRGLLEAGDVEEGLRAAAAIGDDRLQRMQTGFVQPEGFTHGSSEQRSEWLQRGLRAVSTDACNTFRAGRP